MALHQGETFFTMVGCLDGRCQKALLEYGKKRFEAQFADTITDIGIVGELTINPPEQFLDRIKRLTLFSITKHNAKGILVGGHQECGGNQIDDVTHKSEIKKAISLIRDMTDQTIPVVGVFVKRNLEDPSLWEAEEV